MGVEKMCFLGGGSGATRYLSPEGWVRVGPNKGLNPPANLSENGRKRGKDRPTRSLPTSAMRCDRKGWNTLNVLLGVLLQGRPPCKLLQQPVSIKVEIVVVEVDPLHAVVFVGHLRHHLWPRSTGEWTGTRRQQKTPRRSAHALSDTRTQGRQQTAAANSKHRRHPRCARDST